MSINDYFYGNVKSDELSLDIEEAVRRLNIEKYLENSVIKECEKNLRSAMDCKYCAVKTDVKHNGDSVQIGFIDIKSRDLIKTLDGSNEAFVIAVTLGSRVDRLLNKLSVTSVAEHFITDAISSAFAETLIDYVEEKIKGDNVCSRRFSPGYGDLPLEIQTPLLEMLNASRLLNININKSLLMSPTKSITAIMGIKE